MQITPSLSIYMRINLVFNIAWGLIKFALIKFVNVKMSVDHFKTVCMHFMQFMRDDISSVDFLIAHNILLLKILN